MSFYLLHNYENNQRSLKQSLQSERIERERLQELDRLKSHFFTNISHEFRTPLALILGLQEKLSQKIQDPNERKDLSMIQKNANHLLRLINELQELSRLEFGHLKLRAIKTDIVQYLRTWIAFFESAASQKRLTLKFNPKKEIMECWFDPDKLRKVIFNLISNAIKFTSEGNHVEIACEIHMPELGHIFNTPLQKITSGFIEIKISDTGIGIPEERLPFIFDRFYHVDDSNTMEHRGTGIGLSISKELIELHHGTINAQSAAGKGTVFTIHLPLGKAHLEKDEITDSEENVKSASITDTGDLNAPNFELKSDEDCSKDDTIVLVVEDNDELRAFITIFDNRKNGSISPEGQAFLQRVIKIIENHLSEVDFSVEILGQEIGMSASTLRRKFRRFMKQSPNDFIRTIRLKHGQRLLEKSTSSITQIAYEVGFVNPSYFAKCFKEHFGYSPSEFKKRSKNC